MEVCTSHSLQGKSEGCSAQGNVALFVDAPDTLECFHHDSFKPSVDFILLPPETVHCNVTSSFIYKIALILCMDGRDLLASWNPFCIED